MFPRRQSSGVGVALLGMSAAAMISVFAFGLLPKFLGPARNAVPPIAVDLFLGPKLAASPEATGVGRMSASAKRHGLAALSGTDQGKPGT